MAQNVAFALGTTVLASSPVVIPAGSTANFAIYTDSAAGIPANEGIEAFLDTPGQDQPLAPLTPKNPTLSIAGPAEVIFKRLTVTSVNVGVVQYA